MSDRPTRVVLIEDDDDHAELTRRALNEPGLGVDLVRLRDGAAALDLLLRRGPFVDAPRPDLVLLDLRLPVVDGLEVLATVKSSPDLRDLPVVALTASASDRDLREAYEHHVNAFLRKPADPQHLAQMLHDTASFWLRWNRKP